MKPFTAPISDRSRELYGRYMPRYESIPSMRPFNIDISDRRRELFGEYMRRYEEVPSMQPFDADIGDRSRHLFGEYRQRWSSLKEASIISFSAAANGLNWVDCAAAPASRVSPKIFNEAMYQYQALDFGGWAGTPTYRVMMGDTKVYPFLTDEPLDVTGNWKSLGILSTGIRTGETINWQIRSDNAADGAGQTVQIYAGIVIFADR